MNSFYRRSKWTKYTIMRQFEDLKPHLPKTQKLTHGAFEEMITRHDDMIVKPVDGSRGAGVIRIYGAGSNHRYIVHTENIKRTILGKARTYDYVNKRIGTRSHIIQRRVPLATINGRPFDVRVIVQRRTLSDPWKVTGKVAKVAGKGYIVTNNARSKGTVMMVENAMKRSSLKHLPHLSLVSSVNQVALTAAERLGNSIYSNQHIFGFDMGLDGTGHVWIIEVNLKPLFSHFRKLQDKTMYRKILRYHKMAVNTK